MKRATNKEKTRKILTVLSGCLQKVERVLGIDCCRETFFFFDCSCEFLGRQERKEAKRRTDSFWRVGCEKAPGGSVPENWLEVRYLFFSINTNQQSFFSSSIHQSKERHQERGENKHFLEKRRIKKPFQRPRKEISTQIPFFERCQSLVW